MKTILKFASVAVFGVMAMAVTVSVKPISVGLVSEAKAALQECIQRCNDKRSSCLNSAKTGGESTACYDAKRECDKDCEANAK